MSDQRQSAHQLIDKVFDFVAELSQTATVKLRVSDLSIDITIDTDDLTPKSDAARFLANRTEHVLGYSLPSSLLYTVYLDWCVAQQISPVNINVFSQHCRAYGLVSEHRGGIKVWLNVAFKPELKPEAIE